MKTRIHDTTARWSDAVIADQINWIPFAADDDVRLEDRDVLGLDERQHLASTADLQSTLRWVRRALYVALERIVALTAQLARANRTIEFLHAELRDRRAA
jgi:hypothetical protein